MGLAWEDLGDGYWRVQGGLFALYELNVVTVTTRCTSFYMRLEKAGRRRRRAFACPLAAVRARRGRLWAVRTRFR